MRLHFYYFLLVTFLGKPGNVGGFVGLTKNSVGKIMHGMKLSVSPKARSHAPIGVIPGTWTWT